jgi:hypothetical protein
LTVPNRSRRLVVNVIIRLAHRLRPGGNPECP